VLDGVDLIGPIPNSAPESGLEALGRWTALDRPDTRIDSVF
jgi:hypothetical protein